MLRLRILLGLTVIIAICGCGGTDTGNPITNDISGPSISCPQDAKVCPDGSSVERDPANNCEFKKCPGEA